MKKRSMKSLQVGCRHNVVTSLCEGSNGDELRTLAGRGCQGTNTAFKSRHALLKDVDSRLVKLVSGWLAG